VKNFLIALIAGLCCCLHAKAQIINGVNLAHTRSIRINYVSRDSVNLALNDAYELIEDSCKQVIRYARLKQRKFYGKIKDVSSLDISLVLTDGNYNADGQKDGYFITHYLNGQLQAKGSFKNDRYDGKWETYYNDGKPRLVFEANGNDKKIINAWDVKGTKIIDDGKGSYRADLGSIYWKGKLLNGKPDGTWVAIKTNDANEMEVLNEKYKNGSFIKGSGPLGAYTDASRLELVAADLLPFTHAELMRISMVPCDGVKRKAIVSAQFRNGSAAFSQYIVDLVGPTIGKIDLRKYQGLIRVDINGEVGENGVIVKLVSNSPYHEIYDKLIPQLRNLPPLFPATIDGKPTTEKITMSFTIEEGVYHYSYQLLPVGR
jgi:hypothetical protein